MGGGAAVIGTLRAVAALKLQTNVVGLVPLTENMMGGRAVKVMDVITAKNGKTIEVGNTDAEGRLILADALCYAEKFKAKAIIDLATLTGKYFFIPYSPCFFFLLFFLSFFFLYSN
jgi:leucyl aminopeptidase